MKAIFTVRGALTGVRHGLPLMVSTGAYGLVFGVLARQSGMSVVDTGLMSGLVCAGASQLIVLDLWRAPLPIWPIILTTLLVNLRHLLLGMSLRSYLPTIRPLHLYGSAFFLSDESWALTTRASSEGQRDGAFLLGVGGAMWCAWVLRLVV